MLTMTTRPCRECGRSFEAASASFIFQSKSCHLEQHVCDDCVEAYDKRIADPQRQGSARAPWESICDAAYLGFDLTRLPETSRGFAAKVFAWQDGAKGIGLAGPSRIGKTFIVTELFRRHYEYGKSVKMVLGTEFAYACGSPDGDERRRMIDSCIAVEMLFIDDIAKPKMTDRVEADLFHVLERRKRTLRPVFVTLNGNGQTLAAMLSSEGANALVNRLRHDVCEFMRLD
jgi:hypothetical protein